MNLAEGLGRFARDSHDAGSNRRRLEETPIEIGPFLAARAERAAALWPVARPCGLGLGDRACLALAQVRRLPAVTADRAWTGLRLDIEVRSVR